MGVFRGPQVLIPGQICQFGNWPVFSPLSESLKDLSVRDKVLLVPLELQLYCKSVFL